MQTSVQFFSSLKFSPEANEPGSQRHRTVEKSGKDLAPLHRVRAHREWGQILKEEGNETALKGSVAGKEHENNENKQDI